MVLTDTTPAQASLAGAFAIGVSICANVWPSNGSMRQMAGHAKQAKAHAERIRKTTSASLALDIKKRTAVTNPVMWITI